MTNARTRVYKNPHGETKHSGQDWSINDWMVATLGELGEAANVLKKIRRHDFDLNSPKAQRQLRQEFADAVIYLGIMATKVGIDLEDAVRDTFNARSRKQKMDIFL